MTPEPNSQDDLRDDLIDSLLLSMHQSSVDKAQSLVTVGLASLDDDSSRSDSPRLETGTFSTKSTRSPRWLARPATIGLAACALILFMTSLTLFDQSSTAVGAVRKSLDQALVDVGRQYSVVSNVRLKDNETITIRSDLHVRGGDQFAWRVKTGAAKDFCFGSDRGQAWVVPPVGPVIEGGSQSLVDWAAGRNDLSGPYLHVSAILQRMSDEYALQFSIDRSAPAVPSHLSDCQHVIGYRKDPHNYLAPDEVELWADEESGVAKRIVKRWKVAADSAGWLSVTTELVKELTLSDDFFTADAHGGANRARIHFNPGEIR